MKPVQQTRLGKEGNCFAACLASILELPLEAIPDLMDSRCNTWLEKYNDWLLDSFRLYLWNLAPASDLPSGVVCMATHMCQQPAFHLIGGKSERGRMHSVVGFQGKLVFDPHPDNVGLARIVDYGFFMSLDPSREFHPMTPKHPQEQPA